MLKSILAIVAFAGCAVDAPDIWIIEEPPAKAAPGAVVLLHGAGEDGAAIAARWNVPGEVLTPSAGSDDGWRGSVACCGTPSDVDQLALEGTLRAAMLPGQKAIIMGQGAGGFMAWRMGCAHPDLVGAIVMVGAAANAEGDAPCAPGVVSVLHVHGTVDDVVNYGGGRLPGMLASYPSASESSAQARALVACDHAEHLPEPELGTPTESIGCSYWTAGTNYRAEHWRVIGWDHNPQLPANFGELALTWATEHGGF